MRPSRSVECVEASRLGVEEVLARLDTSLEGLTRLEAAARLRAFGENTIARERPPHPLKRLLRLFASPLSILLLLLAAIAGLTGEPRGAAVIASCFGASARAIALYARSKRSHRLSRSIAQ